MSYFAKRYGGSTWQDILEHDRTVVLGEAGSGKTWELEARAEILKDEGKAAFFVRVEHISSGLDRALGSTEYQRYLGWLNNANEVGYFFLDATDECRITSHHALEQALRDFANELGSSLKKAKIVLSCRVSEWQPKTDPEIILRILELTREKIRVYQEKKAKPLQILQLAPLDRAQVTKLARIKIPETAERFLETITDQELWLFVGRPSDALNLISYWRDNDRIGALHEVIETDIRHKLADTNPNRPHSLLPEQQARQGAMQLAAATQLCRAFSFPLSDPNPSTATAPSVINPRTILPNWRPEEIDSLLSCALFDEASYGRIRFHHRTIAEYLAAEWLHQQIEKGCPHSAIIQLLFKESHGQTVLIPSLAPVAAWLSSKHVFVRRKVIEVSPETLIHSGDPTLLTVEDRKAILKELAKRTRVHLGYGIFAQIKRLAIPDLAPLINELLNDSTVSSDAKLSLLLIAGEGHLADCADIALAIASDLNADATLIQYAIHALGSIASQTHLRALCDCMIAREALTPKIAAELCRAAYPQTLTEGELKSLVIKTNFPAQNHASNFSINLGYAIDGDLPENRLANLIRTLVAIAQLEPHEPERQFGQFEGLSRRFTWIFDPLSKVVARALAPDSQANVSTQDMATAIRTLESIRAIDHYYNSNKELVEPLRTCRVELRRNLFWREVESQRASRSTEDHILVPSHYDLWNILPADIDWLLEDSTNKASENDRLLAYRYVLTYWRQNGQPQPLKKKLNTISRTSTAHRKLYNGWVNNRIRRAYHIFKLTYLNRYRYINWDIRITRWGAQTRWKVQTIFYALTHPRLVKEGRNYPLLNNFFVLANGDRAIETKRGNYNRANLERKIGKRLARLVREGFKAYWKEWVPPLPEHKLRGTAYNGTHIAMLGLTAETQDGLDWSNLTEELARKAALHSLYELNGVPTWLDRLIDAKASVVRQVYREQLASEFSLPADRQFANGLIHDLAHGDFFLQELCLPDLIELLSNNDPVHLDILKYTVRVLTSRNAREVLKTIAPDRTRSALASADRKRFAMWLGVWVQVDCPAVLDFLDAQQWGSPEEAYETILSICDNLYSHFSARLQVSGPNYLELPNLPRFLSFLYTHVKPQEDQYHEGVHSPDSRDNAQHFRSDVLKHLIESPPEIDAYSAMIEFANLLPDGEEKQRILERAAERARIEADRRWQEDRFVAFSKRYEAPPANSDELFFVALDRLDDIKDSLEHGDFSPRNFFESGDHEQKIQLEIARLLDITCRGSYEVVREAEVADDKEIDIRLLRQGLNPVTIEIKWAHKWSYNDHITAIRDQLVGQYMRNNRSQNGIYLMVNLDPGHQWRPDGAQMIEFEALTARLQVFADTLMAGRGGHEKLTVVGIELSPGR